MKKIKKDVVGLIIGAGGALALSASAEFGPVANEEDQFRGIWDFEQKAYEEIRDTGFNLFLGAPCLAETNQKMVKDKAGYVIQLRFAAAEDLRKKYPRYNRDGSKDERTMDWTEPGCLDELRERVKGAAKSQLNNPAFFGMQPVSEVGLFTRPSFSPRHQAAWKAVSGNDIPSQAFGREAPCWTRLKDLPADRLIDDTYNPYAYYRWFWTQDDGINPYIEMAVDEFESAFGRKMFTMTDPATRHPPAWGMGGKVSHINDWQVCYTFPFQHSYLISKMQSMARGRPGQKVLTIVQGIFGRRDSSPVGEEPSGVPATAWHKDRPNAAWITPPPDMMREAFWSAFARQTDGVLVHGWDCIWDGSKYGRSKEGEGYQFTNPQTKRMISKLFHEVAIPLGPLFKRAEERAPVVGLMETLPSALLSGAAPYNWKSGFDCHRAGVVATAANLAPYTLYDEEILQGIPPSVKVILAPEAFVLTKRVAAKLKEFQARGGKILARSDFAPGMAADGALPPTRYESREFSEYAAFTNRNFNAHAKDAALRLAAAEFKAEVGRYIDLYADSDNPYILAYARVAGTSADLVFAYNTKRDYGDYLGPWKRILDHGVPAAGTVTVGRKAGAVYDLVKHAEAKFEVKSGRIQIPVSWPTTDGSVFLVTEKPLADLSITAADGGDGVTVTVTTPDRDMLIPIEVKVGGMRAQSGVVANGIWKRTFKSGDVGSGGKVEVVSLATGRKTTAESGRREHVFFVGAHPDDSEGFAGTAFLLKDKYQIHFVDLTRGENGLGLQGRLDGSTAKIRVAEETEACKLLGAMPHFLCEINGDCHASAKAAAEFEALMLQYRPRAVFTHWPVDRHSDHVQCAAVVLAVYGKLFKEKSLWWDPEHYFFEVLPGQTLQYPPLYSVDLTKTMDCKVELLRKYDSQNKGDWLVKAKLDLAQKRGVQRSPTVKYAETFSTWNGKRIVGGVLESLAETALMDNNLKFDVL
ncbi:MAG: PIG-L family deacetylase [Kiritimatiellae bacterium]|nr:PIG-L family deacetylase [Kiritimatiellia bacterium]